MDMEDWILVDPQIELWVKMFTRGTLAACWVLKNNNKWEWNTANDNAISGVENTKELAMFLAELKTRAG